MSRTLSAIFGREVAGLALTAGLLLAAAALGLVGLCCLAFALYLHLQAGYGALAAASITAAAFLAAALLLGILVRSRMGGSAAASAPAAPASGEGEVAAVLVALLQRELPKNAVPATVLALVGGVAAGLNPGALKQILGSLTERPR